MSDGPFSPELNARVEAAMADAIVHRMYFLELITPKNVGDKVLTREEATEALKSYIQATSLKVQVNEPPEPKNDWE